MSDKFYITTTLPYVNSEPHIGFALEIVQADAIARWQSFLGKEVLFNTGTDEHGLKIYRKAIEAGQEPQAYCDFYAARFDALKKALNLSYTNFIRTTDPYHMQAAQEFWRRCAAAGDIYKKNYKIKYCVGCELEKTESELVDGKCTVHPNLEIEIHEEENYFFRFSRFQKPLLELYEKNPEFTVPVEKLNEIRAFVERGLEDFSISRLKAKMPWGIAVPDDEDQVMYVWFDALINYVSTLGWPSSAKASEGKPATSTEPTNFDLFWPGFQVAGKDNLRQQSAMWQAMLMSAGLEPSAQILIHGFVTADGAKMSKSLGNVIDPFEIAEKYGTDALRYYLLAEFTPFEDGDFTIEKFEKRFNGDLANGLGNLAARTATLLERNRIELALAPGNEDLNKEVAAKMAEFRFDEALKAIWRKLAESDEWLSEKKPWKSTDPAEIKAALLPVAQNLSDIGRLLKPFMPETAQKIAAQFGAGRVQKGESLFPRLN
jgi:methionyl-tRNA synthetase